ncbi:peptidase M30 [Brachyspira pilosicoli]|uniref:Peptidase M30 n=1 Tax=Brachyspira pilosicoli TaxID=52584 RepID=A0AAJ6GD13_BRAPL|nr:peptidase M30 [Brachyspira pilosicoli]WIH90156.1 peptidase M30 [Brachyspira pilosicoli]WIH92447.1 peptidase M30 [Brachyspira pilosicoli]WIH94739.1 peptidase M30 [Brachyspira pilosicoli]
MNFKLIFITLISSILISCYSPFFLTDTEGFSVYRSSSSGSGLSSDFIKATIAKETENLIVYVEKGESYNSSSLDLVCNEFEKYYAKEKSIYGNHTDVDDNGKIIILFLDLNPESGNGSILNGYFNPADLIDGQGNNADMLYMDLGGLNNNPYYMAGTILHELQHLINYNVNVLGNGRDMEVWLNEALSESTSVLFNRTTVNSRNIEFNKINYYCFYTWDLPINVFANYPSASVFMNWLYIKSGYNDNIFKNIAASKEVNAYRRVLSTVGTISSSWDSLLIQWIEDVNNGLVSGAKINKIDKTYANTYIPLFPGALLVFDQLVVGNIDTSSISLLKSKQNNNSLILLNNDTYVGNSPTAVNITFNSSSSSILRSAKSSAQTNSYLEVISNTKPKYRNILLK